MPKLILKVAKLISKIGKLISTNLKTHFCGFFASVGQYLTWFANVNPQKKWKHLCRYSFENYETHFPITNTIAFFYKNIFIRTSGSDLGKLKKFFRTLWGWNFEKIKNIWGSIYKKKLQCLEETHYSVNSWIHSWICINLYHILLSKNIYSTYLVMLISQLFHSSIGKTNIT